MWGQLNTLTKQFAEQASQAVKDAGIDKRLENVSQQMAGGLDKLANSVLTVEEAEASQTRLVAEQPHLESSQVRPRGLMAPIRNSNDSQNSSPVAKGKRKVKKSRVEDVQEENELLKQRLAGVEAAAADALGELEEYKERLEKATDRKTTSEQDLQKAKREISKLRKQVKSAQSEISTRTAESENLKEDIALLRQSTVREAGTEIGNSARANDSQTEQHVDPTMAAEVGKLSALLRGKDGELSVSKAEIKARDEELEVGRSLVESLRQEISELKTAQEVQQQQAKRQEIELGNASRKLSSSRAALEEKQVELDVVATSLQALFDNLEKLQTGSDRVVSRSVELSNELKETEKALRAKEAENVALLVGIEGIVEIVAGMDESCGDGDPTPQAFAELKNALDKIRRLDGDENSPTKASTDLEQSIRKVHRESMHLKSVVLSLRNEAEMASFENENHKEELMEMMEELSGLYSTPPSKPSANVVNLQILVKENADKVSKRDKDAATEALKSQVQKSESANRALKAELRSCQEEIENLLEGSSELEAMIASKATENGALREGARAESNLSIEKLRNAQAELAETQERAKDLEEQVTELESEVSTWRNHAETRGGEIDAASSSISGLEQEVVRLKGLLESERTAMSEKASESTKKIEQRMTELMESRVAVAREEEQSNARSREDELRTELGALEETVGKLRAELSEVAEVADQVGALEASKSDLEKELSDAKLAMSDMESSLSESHREAASLEQKLDAQISAAEDRKKKFMMLQTTFKNKESELLEEISELRAEIEGLGMENQLAVEESAVMESDEFEELRKEYEKLQENIEQLEKRCSELESELWEQKEESSALTIKIGGLESLNKENDATISELQSSADRFKQLLAGAESQSQQSDEKLLQLEAELSETKKKVETEEGQLQAAEIRVLEAEARAEAAERSKIKMSLALADMDEQKASKEQESSTTADTRETASKSNPEVEALKSQLALAEEQSKQLQWQVKMMTKANESEGKSNPTSWIFGCVSNRKQ
ncbi:hypothetical protein BSKO_05394 [Bryopsis sp. KO-2023]|nr:hypothetical protein BSKO_05394 [Bryopsis sp. KO-2023]